MSLTNRKQGRSIDAHALRESNSTRTRAQLGPFAGGEQRRLPSGQHAVRHGLADEQRDLRLAGPHQLYDMIPWRILHILPINSQYLITWLQLSYAGPAFGNKSHNNRPLAARHKAEAETSAALQLHEPWLRRMLVPAYAFRRLIRCRLIQMATRSEGNCNVGYTPLG